MQEKMIRNQRDGNPKKDSKGNAVNLKHHGRNEGCLGRACQETGHGGTGKRWPQRLTNRNFPK